VRDGILSLGLTVVSRTLLCRDRLNGSLRHMLGGSPPDAARLVIQSGDRRLSAVYLRAGEDAPVFLICHGIGERVEYWGRVQRFLQTLGASSLVFNYSGYGASSGRVSVAHCEEDAMAAYRELVDRGHRAVFLLGFSLGSGVASGVAPSLEVKGVILCEGYSTLREGAVAAIGLPVWITRLVPNVWENVRRVSELRVPILVVHSDADRLFPVSMAKRVAAACGECGELLVINGLSHNEPIFNPTEIYWRPVVEWAMRVIS
jgi:alpha-beta hydrolase superfamily lysophospholipase